MRPNIDPKPETAISSGDGVRCDDGNARLQRLLEQLERRAPVARIDLRLDRVRQVLDRMSLDLDSTRIVSVAGTNGKGSTVAFLEALAAATGRRCVAFTSPHVAQFGERIREDGHPIADERIAEALIRVEHVRNDIELTWFEQVTLAAIDLVGRIQPDWFIAEVGMGGRLDAVNALDADVAVITSIGLDHQQYLGRTRAAIAREKAGIARPGRPLIVAERRPPRGMTEHLVTTGAELRQARIAFDWRWHRGSLSIRDGERRWSGLSLGLVGAHQGGNAAAAVVAARCLQPELDGDAIRRALAEARLTGRFETIAESPRVIVDVAHNPAAVRMLARQVRALEMPPLVVFAALADKDVTGMVRALRPVTAEWFLAALDVPRGLSAKELLRRMPSGDSGSRPEALESVPKALDRARRAARPEQAVVVFGSFFTVAEAIACIHPTRE